MPLLKRKRVLAAKVEGTPGTAESLGNSEGAFNAYNVMAQASITVEEREGQGAFNYLPGVPGARSGTVTFRTDLGWDGSNTEPTWASVLLPACGWRDVANVYTPTTEDIGSNVKTITLGVYVDGTLKRLAGAAGTFQMVLPAGRMAYIDWTFTGVWQAPTNTALISPTYPTAAALRFASGSMTFASVAKKVEQVTIDAGNNVILREDASTAAGYSTALITNRNPRITANPEAVLITTYDHYATWTAANTGAMAIVVAGPSNSTFTINAPAAQIFNVQEGDRNGMVVEDIEWACTKGNTNDAELTFTFA